MRSSIPGFVGLVAAPFLLAATACDRSTAPGPRRAVEFRLAAPVVATLAGTAGAASAPLVITSFRIAVFAASLGRDGQFGCIDCNGNTDDGPSMAALIDVPLSGADVRVATEQVSVGRYGAVEFSLGVLDPRQYPSPVWEQGTTLEIQGRFGGVPFRLALPVSGVFRQVLPSAVDVAVAGASTLQVTIALPVASWFVSNGVPLDPNNAASRAVIEANIRRGFLPPESASASEK